MRTTAEHDFVRFRRTGDPEALGRVFDALAPKLLLVADHLARGMADAEDLVQTTFLGALRDAARWDERRPLLAWLTGILVHRAQDARRRAGVRAERPLEDAPEPRVDDDPRAGLELRELAERVSRAIDALEEPYREVLVLRAVHGLSPTEIAHSLGRAPGTVRMQLQRGRERLREALPTEVALPALLLADDGRGLATVREAVLTGATPSVPIAPAASLVSRLSIAPRLSIAMALVAAATVAVVWSPWSEGRSAVESAREGEVVGAPVYAARELVPEEPREGTAPATAGGRRLASTPEASVVPVPAPLVTGRVVTSTLDRGVAGATVFALDPSRPDGQRVLGTTDASGGFAVGDVQVGDRLGARAPGWQLAGFGKRSGLQEVRAAEDGGFERLLLMLGAPGVPLSGRVLDPHGSGVARARVLVAVDEDARKGEPPRPDPEIDRECLVLLADAEGRFATDEVPAGRVLLVARPAEPGVPGVAWTLADVRTDASNAFELTLRTGARVVGLVLDEQGRSVPGLDVVARWGGSRALGELEDELGPLLADVRLRTDDSGRYALEGLLPGRHEVVVAAGGRELAARRLELADGESATFDVTVPLLTRLAARVLDDVGEPLVGWGVSFSTGDDGRDWSAMRELGLPRRTDHAGRVAIDGLDPVPVQLAIYRPFPAGEGGKRDVSILPCALRDDVWPGAGEVVVTVTAGERAEGRLRGRWIDAQGAPLARSSLTLHRTGWTHTVAASTDAEGAFSVAGLAPGAYELVADENRRYPRGSRLASVDLAPGADVDLGPLVLPEPTRVSIAVEAGSAPEPFDANRPELACEHDGRCAGSLSHPRDSSTYPSSPLAAGRHRYGLWSVGYAPLVGRVEAEEGRETRVTLTAERGIEVVFELEVTDPRSLESLASGSTPHLMWALRGAEGQVLARIKTDPVFDPATRRLHDRLRLAPGPARLSVLDDNRSPERAELGLAIDVRAGGSDAPVRAAFPR